eukprot:TRINITY_DN24902_c0_g1_i1.p1 TRINITY_DN24902_c0_g1~~TRINITY_DN24902_c0_g1_i1.p1  ORF type:complete len:395 (+),score=54.39 TRINITY_DN24902_c0_g1_i1:44-1186(+)
MVLTTSSPGAPALLVGSSILSGGFILFCCCRRRRDAYKMRLLHRKLMKRAMQLQDSDSLAAAANGLASKPLVSRGTEGDALPSGMLVAVMEYLFSRRSKPMQDEELQAFTQPGPENLIAIDSCAAGSYCCLWPGVSAAKRHVVLYIPGTSYSGGTIQTSKAFAGQLSKLFQCPVILPKPLGINNLSDEVQNITQCLQWLSSKVKDRHITIIADSFGCEVAVGAVSKNESLGESKKVNCNAVVLISPIMLAYNVSAVRLRDSKSERDPMFPGYTSSYVEFVKRLTNNHSNRDRSVLPRQSPPVLFVSSESELFATNVRKLYLDARRADIPSEHIVVPNTPHSLPLYCNVLPEARDVLSRIITFVEAQVTSDKAPSPGSDVK